MNEIKLPKCSMAADDEEILKQKREELRERLVSGKPISIGKNGEVGTSNSGGSTFIPGGKLAALMQWCERDSVLLQAEKEAVYGEIPNGRFAAEDEEILKQKREELRERLVSGKPISIGKNGEVGTSNSGGSTFIPGGKLAALMQWYERDPVLLQAEKEAMRRDFPQFSLIKLDDGRLAWVGDVKLNVMGDNSWRLMAVYQPNHPVQQMGSSVYVYLVEPSIEDLIEQLGWRPHHLLRDSNNRNYLCTTEAGYVKATSTQVTSANTVLRWAIKWLLCFELVLTGDMTTEEFDKPHGI